MSHCFALIPQLRPGRRHTQNAKQNGRMHLMLRCRRQMGWRGGHVRGLNHPMIAARSLELSTHRLGPGNTHTRDANLPPCCRTNGILRHTRAFFMKKFITLLDRRQFYRSRRPRSVGVRSAVVRDRPRKVYGRLIHMADEFYTRSRCPGPARHEILSCAIMSR